MRWSPLSHYVAAGLVGVVAAVGFYVVDTYRTDTAALRARLAAVEGQEPPDPPSAPVVPPDLSGDVAAVRSELADLAGRIEGLEEAVSAPVGSSVSASDLQPALEALAGSVADLEGQVDGLEDDVDGLLREVGPLASGLRKTLREQVDDLEACLVDLLRDGEEGLMSRCPSTF